MNKYQKAFEQTRKVVTADTLDAFTTLKELVDKATPKKPILHEFFNDIETIYNSYGGINESVVCCPNCRKQHIFDFEYNHEFNYCANCGQAIDWSDKDVK